jgi:plasmid replication initiation protein
MKKNLKISNSFVNSLITKNNYLTLKILFYMVLNGEIKKDKNLNEITLNLVELKKILNLDFKNLRQNIKHIQKTLITIKEDKNIIDLTLIPKVIYDYEKQIIKIYIFDEILKELKELKNKFTIIDLTNLIYLKNKHSIRLLTILENIDGYDKCNKVKYFEKQELNEIFDTNYAGIKEIERSIILPIQKELNQFSKLTFLYDLVYDIDTLKQGRKPLKGIKIYLKDNKTRQLSLF